jgi:alpha-1,2-mannosyltransferase
LFLYPPTFVPLILPFGLLTVGPATWAWTVTMLMCFVGAVALLPVTARTKWIVVLLAGLSWPFVYNIKLGQVGPLLLLLFTIGWRGLDRALPVGIAGGGGAAIKLQPAIVLVWALLTRRWAAAIVGAGVLAGLAVVATIIVRFGAWSDFVTLITRVNDPITTPHNFTPGAVAYQLGVPRDAAAAIQWVSTAAVLVIFVGAALRLDPAPSYMVAVIASQLISPVLWDHYGIVLLLPVAWLLDRGHWWAMVFILVTPVALVGVVPDWIYPTAFWACLLAVVAIGIRGSASVRGGAPVAQPGI